MTWLHRLIVLGVMVSAARGQEGEKEAPPGEADAASDVSTTTELDNDDGEVPKSSNDPIEPTPPPDWVRDARWYYLDVSHFRNAESENDFPRELPWGTKDVPQDYTEWSLYGGDLQGFREKIPYLKELGVNALLLDGVFPSTKNRALDSYFTLKHVREGIGVICKGEPEDCKSEFRTGDLLLLDIISEAQKQGFHIVIKLPIQKQGRISKMRPRSYWPVFYTDIKETLWQMNDRWLRKPGESTTDRGIDGWALQPDAIKEIDGLAHWRAGIKSINRNCVLLALNPTPSSERAVFVEKHVDAALYTEPSDLVVRLFGEQAAGRKIGSTRDLEAARQKLHECVPRIDGGLTWDPRLFNCLTYDAKRYGEKEPVEAIKVATAQVVDRWRLAMVFQLLYSNDYAIPFGEEVGMVHEGPPWYPEPMWWNDLPNPESKRPTYRGDFYALIQMLNTFRARFAPLRRGDFKPVIADDEKKLLAFARTMPGDEVILVMNYGDTKQSVSLTVGQPGELVPVLSPQLKPLPMPRKGQPAPPEPDLTKIPELRVGAQREFVKLNGTIDFWVDPMGVRIVLIGDSARGGKK